MRALSVHTSGNFYPIIKTELFSKLNRITYDLASKFLDSDPKYNKVSFTPEIEPLISVKTEDIGLKQYPDERSESAKYMDVSREN